MLTLVQLWRGEVPIGQAFLFWGIGVTAVVNLFSTLLGLALASRDAPAWIALGALLAAIPWNILVLVGVWRGAPRSSMPPGAILAMRLAMLAWVGLLCLT